MEVTQPASTGSGKTCDLNQINFAFIQRTSYSDFFVATKNLNTKLGLFELKNIYKFLDAKTLGYFTSSRWTSFSNLFLNSFIACDTDNDCIINESELSTCLASNDTKVITDYISDGFSQDTMVKEIIYSLDVVKNGGLNLDNYLLFKKIVIGFRQFNVDGKLEKDTFYSALKVSFIDKLIDQLDSELAFRMAINLMFDTINNYKLNFMQYFEICRLANSFFTFGYSIGEGFITKDQVVNNFEGARYPTKLNTYMYEEYFNLFNEDKDLNVIPDNTKLDPLSLRFEDFSTLEFWANIFTNYTDPTQTIPSLNMTGFKDLFLTNKYMRMKYWVYIAYSNFQDYASISNSTIAASNITDYDFLTNFNLNFVEVKTKKKSNFLKTSVFEKLGTLSSSKNNLRGKSQSRTGFKSLFQIQLENQQDSSSASSGAAGDSSSSSDAAAFQEKMKPLVEPALEYYYPILDLNYNGYISFDEFIVIIKYLRMYDKLNKNNLDTRGILPSICVNCK